MRLLARNFLCIALQPVYSLRQNKSISIIIPFYQTILTHHVQFLVPPAKRQIRGDAPCQERSQYHRVRVRQNLLARQVLAASESKIIYNGR
jgi:hypothetical protein